jgi:tRNA pseudouridine32 synthase/23S rRNA pseudouridine746 synthase
VVHADDWLLVVEKLPGMPSVPARTDHDPPSVIERLRAAEPGGFLEAAHRLDRDTSGLLVVARSAESRRRLALAFERGLVWKRYIALVEGSPPADSGTLHLPLARDPDSPPRQRVDPVMGVRATTRWRLLQAGVTKACGHEDRASLLELEPVTGRSHQLRVHLSWLGTPIVGDPLYGRRSKRPIGRMLLHAASIDLPHPRDDARLVLRSQADFMPADWIGRLPATSPTSRPFASTARTG